MPELPEVEALRAFVAERAVGQAIRHAQLAEFSAMVKREHRLVRNGEKLNERLSQVHDDLDKWRDEATRFEQLYAQERCRREDLEAELEAARG